MNRGLIFKNNTYFRSGYLNDLEKSGSNKRMGKAMQIYSNVDPNILRSKFYCRRIPGLYGHGRLGASVQLERL